MHTATSRGRLRCALLALGLFVLAPLAAADEAAEFRAAVDSAAAQYQSALQVLETRGRDETTVEVERFRAAWQVVIDRFESMTPAPHADTDLHAETFTEIDARIVGALIVIGIGSRDAARDALAPVGETLARFKAMSAPPKPAPSTSNPGSP